jgi:hypothetical protein
MSLLTTREELEDFNPIINIIKSMSNELEEAIKELHQKIFNDRFLKFDNAMDHIEDKIFVKINRTEEGTFLSCDSLVGNLYLERETVLFFEKFSQLELEDND